MFRFFRKHSWILIVTLSLTIISFVCFMGMGPSRAGGGRGNGSGNLGTLYGREISADDFERAKREFYISYWQQTGEWPNKSPDLTADQLDRQIYSYILINRKAKQLGIYVGENEVVTAANIVLRSPAVMHAFGTTQPVPPDQFAQQLLAPEGLTAADFENSVRTRLEATQLIDVLGLPGALVTPQEAGALYDRENQEVSAQAVFFSASNYLAQASSSPAAIAQFYTNNMAAYREPDRVQINYVSFSASNFLAQSKAEWAKTNLEQTVDGIYQRYGATQFADEKTPEAAKNKIRDLLIQRRALSDAAVEANDFVSALYAMNPAKPENLTILAKQKGLTVLTSAPFSESGPEDFDAPAALTKAAFQLNADSPYTGPIAGSDDIYVIALAGQFPSMIPSFDQIHNRVARDFEFQQAVAFAQMAGTNFYYSAATQMAAGKKFPQVAVAAGEAPTILTPFSLSSSEISGLNDRAEVGELKQAAFTTPAGQISRFVATENGGFVLFVQSLLPIDETKKTTDFPQFLVQMRRARASEAFNIWVNTEMNRELRGAPMTQPTATTAGR